MFYDVQDDMPKWGSKVKWALVLTVTIAFGCFCYSAGYTQGQTQQAAQIQQTSDAVAEAFNRLATLQDAHEAQS